MKELQHKRILIVEDLPDNRLVLSYILQDLGALVDEASDGLEALQKIAVSTYDLVLLDIHMPVKSGLEVMAELKKSGNHPPVVALTATSKFDDEAVQELGFSSQILKPINPYKLADQIGNLL
ncbi:response regulator [Pseudobacteriovorax antillogorgiicola]|uniref:Response regulator receiver domain-containing protein n=1 Tax=Pseudobacteriovorax antillogorgiicola TaxID=1513793 RepID=A0A1Y6BAX9_9BACT|nr:response regulator [Pseudobacteriovorax antillogorgiicola]TCS58861.1 response regulator receiver domain-containing protein [Pseudobacteriovorax antillogorgiicola]SME93948.1 Response regulator receiver domain-containing protein [Pseudobacteriovorax antillogorgiicola]